MSGYDAWNSLSASGSRPSHSDGVAPMRTRPRRNVATSCTVRSALSVSIRMRWACGSSASPALVSSIAPRLRTNSGVPSEFSSTRICLDRLGCETPVSSAARVKCRVRATATK